MSGQDETELPVVIMRGGTSKGVYLHARDLPLSDAERDALLLRLMGSPDSIQIDGLGGARPITSKVAIISRSERADADVDYLFAQVDIDHPVVGYRGNCGNISAGVGPFAVDEGLVEALGDEAEVRVYNVNTDKVFVARFPVAAGKAVAAGDFAIPGVPGTGARILLDYRSTIGATTGKLLPSGAAIDEITLEDGRRVAMSVCDVANCWAFVPAADLGLTGSEQRDVLEDEALAPLLSEVRGKAAVLAGMATDWRQADRQAPGLPMLCLLAPAADYLDANGKPVEQSSMDLRAWLIFLGKLHENMAGTAATCLAATSRISGSVAASMLQSENVGSPQLRIGHPRGSMPVEVVTTHAGNGDISFDTLGFSRTARRLLKGVAFLPAAMPTGEHSA